MRKSATVIGVAALLAGAGWSALWVTGRGEVEERLSLERERLAARGVEVRHGTPEIGGFPFAYEVRLPDLVLEQAATGMAITLPELTATASLGEMERIRYAFPERFLVQLPTPPAAEGTEGTGGPALPGTSTVEVEAEGLAVEQVVGEAGMAETTIAAASLLLVQAGAEQARNGALEFRGLSAEIALPPRVPGAETALTLTAEAMDYLATDETEEGRASRIEGTIEDLGLTASTDQPDLGAALAVLAGAPGGGRLRMTLQMGQTEATASVAGADPARSGSVTASTGVSGGYVTIEGGLIDMVHSAENNRFVLEPADPTASLKGGVEVGRIELVYRSPLVPREEMDELVFRLALGPVAPDEALWQSVDPTGSLERGPGEFVIDLLGSARMRPSEVDGLPEEAELGTLTVRHADIALLGAEAETRGEVEFLQPGNRPEGRLTLELTRAMEVLGDLARAGLIGLEMLQTVTMLAANYTRPGDDPETLVVDMEFRGSEVLMNGQPILEITR